MNKQSKHSTKPNVKGKYSIPPEQFEGVWSATPTPLDDNMRVDSASIRRMVAHHLRLGIKGLFLAGTCGEGPWLPKRERRRLVKSTVAAARRRLTIAVQVTDNSSARILDNVAIAKEDGADMAVIAPPLFLMNATPANIEKLYLDAIERSPLPIGIYDRGSHGAVLVPDQVLKTIYSHEKVHAIKDSSADPRRRAIALAVRKKRPQIRLLNGDEFHCDEYMAAGYDGLMLGGAIFNGHLASLIMEAAQSGDLEKASDLQQRMNKIMFAIYGGPKITCWLSGLKKYLVEIGVFSTWKNYLQYPLTPSCEKAIARVIAQDADVLLP